MPSVIDSWAEADRLRSVAPRGHRQPNGLALCALHNKLFDLGTFTVEPAEKRVIGRLDAEEVPATKYSAW